MIGLILLLLSNPIHCFQNSITYSQHRLKNLIKVYQAVLSDELNSSIQNYLLTRQSAVELNPQNVSVSTSKSSENMLAMFKPSGWYSDAYQIDLQSRMDSRTSAIPHPLSYTELIKYGYKSLVDPIMELGGPVKVGAIVGIDWVEPIVEELPVDESLRPIREDTYPLDIRGSLALGGSLDTMLNQAEALNLNEVKRKLSEPQTVGAVKLEEKSTRYELEEPNYLSQDYRRVSKRSSYRSDGPLPSVIKDDGGILNRFTLNAVQRTHFSIMSVSTAIGWGHASQDIISQQLWGSQSNNLITFSQIISAGLMLSSIITAFTNAWFISKSNQTIDKVVWMMKSILGGPYSYIQLNAQTPSKPQTMEKV